MEWREYIGVHENILAGKPVIKGTRITAEFLLDLFALGWTEEDILESYPTVSREALHAVLAYAAETVREQGMRVLEA
jgi:uncharacterized protein (DUF433 family)